MVLFESVKWSLTRFLHRLHAEGSLLQLLPIYLFFSLKHWWLLCLADGLTADLLPIHFYQQPKFQSLCITVTKNHKTDDRKSSYLSTYSLFCELLSCLESCTLRNSETEQRGAPICKKNHKILKHVRQ